MEGSRRSQFAVMSENSELIHWHLRPRLVALLVDAARVPARPPSFAKWHLVSSAGQHCRSRTAGGQRIRRERNAECLPALFGGLTFMHPKLLRSLSKSDLAKKKKLVNVQLTLLNLPKSHFVQSPLSHCFLTATCLSSLSVNGL